MNVWDVVVGLVVVTLIVLAVRLMRGSKCRRSCATCPFAEGCDTQK